MEEGLLHELSVNNKMGSKKETELKWQFRELDSACHVLTVELPDGSQHFWKRCVYLPDSNVDAWALPNLFAQINVI